MCQKERNQKKEVTKELVQKNTRKTARQKQQGIDLEVKMTESIANTWGAGKVCEEEMTTETIT